MLWMQLRFSCVSDVSPLEVTTLDLSNGTVGSKKWMFPVLCAILPVTVVAVQERRTVDQYEFMTGIGN